MRCGALCGVFLRHAIAHQPKWRSLHARRALLYRSVFFNRSSACSVKKLNCVQHLRPLDAFSRLLVGPSVLVVAPLTPLWELTVLPQTSYLAGRGSLPPPQEEPLLRISALRPQKTHGFRGQSKLLQRVPLH